MVNEEQVEKMFRKMISNLTDKQFWEYISSWKDEQSLIDEMLDWDTDTKLEAIRELKKIKLNEIEKRSNQND